MMKASGTTRKNRPASSDLSSSVRIRGAATPAVGVGEVSDQPLFVNLLNFRDVAKTVNAITGSKLLMEGLLFRAARPDDSTLADRRLIKNVYGIKSIMDLRTKTEHSKQAQKREADLASSGILTSNDAVAEPVKIEGLDYLEININGRGFEKGLVKQLRIWSFIKLIILMLLGYRMQAIGILGREVMTPRGLVGLGFDTLDFCGKEIAEALDHLIHKNQYPFLVHCTQGKDRTGLVVALVLFLLEIPIEAIIHDYRLSEKELESERNSRLDEMREMGFPAEFVLAPPAFIPSMRDHLQVKYGGIRPYLSTIGFSSAKQDNLLGILRAD